MNNRITMTLNVDDLILQALREDISSEDVTTNAVMPHDNFAGVFACQSRHSKKIISFSTCYKFLASPEKTASL